jgi:small subunit ribosomal protein S35
VTYAGEPFHPVTPKRTITVPISLLPLTNDTAIHNIKVIADTRWTMEPPKDTGLPQERHTPVYASDEGKTVERDVIAEHGYIKISSESFPEGQMNLKWCMDTLRRLVKEANVRAFFLSFFPKLF